MIKLFLILFDWFSPFETVQKAEENSFFSTGFCWRCPQLSSWPLERSCHRWSDAVMYSAMVRTSTLIHMTILCIDLLCCIYIYIFTYVYICIYICMLNNKNTRPNSHVKHGHGLVLVRIGVKTFICLMVCWAHGKSKNPKPVIRRQLALDMLYRRPLVHG